MTYAAGLLRGWRSLRTDDELTLIATHELAPEVVSEARGFCRVLVLGHRSPISRIFVQQLGVQWATRRIRPDALLTLTPVSPFGDLPCPLVAVVHDLRHLQNGGEFGQPQVAYRRQLYHRTFHKARALIAVSKLTKSHLRRACPRTSAKTVVVYHGSDHVDGWAGVGSSTPYALAFAHWANKRPDIAIQVWAELKKRHPNLGIRLRIVGVPQTARSSLRKLVSRLSLDNVVELHGHLPHSEFQEVFCGATLLVLPSTLEGFGLPLLEAMRLGIPAVAARGSGMEEIAGESVLYADLDARDFADRCAEALSDAPAQRAKIARGRAHAATFLWRAAAASTRAVIVRAMVNAAGDDPLAASDSWFTPDRRDPRPAT